MAYLYTTGLFDRAWPQFRAPIERYVQAYVDGRMTLDDMAANLAAAVPQVAERSSDRSRLVARRLAIWPGWRADQ